MTDTRVKLNRELNEREKDVIKAVNDGVFSNASVIMLSILEDYAIQGQSGEGYMAGNSKAVLIGEDDQINDPVLIALYKSIEETVGRELSDEWV